MTDLYLWIKIIHIFSVISWMVGLLYLPRLFVYHIGLSKDNLEAHETFCTMEKRLIKGIMNPAMGFALASGLWMAYDSGLFSDGWFHAKLTLIVIMAMAHYRYSVHHKNFVKGENKKSANYFRFINEFPAVLMILILILVIFKPF